MLTLIRHVYMVISEIVTFFIYALSFVFLPEYFGKCSVSLEATIDHSVLR